MRLAKNYLVGVRQGFLEVSIIACKGWKRVFTVHWYGTRGRMYKTVKITCFTQVFYVTAFGFVGCILFITMVSFRGCN